MNPNLPPMKREDLEAKVTALLLGELTPDEAALLRELIVRDAGLARLHDRLKLTLELLRETAATPKPASAPMKLSPERREKLLAHFKTVAPKEFAKRPKRKISWLIATSGVAAAVVLLMFFYIPNFTTARTTATRAAIINNLRMLDSAKQQWALEQGKSATDVPTMEDVLPYLGRGERAEAPSGQGQTYVLGAVGQPPVAQLKSRSGKETIITLPGAEKDLAALNKAKPAPPAASPTRGYAGYGRFAALSPQAVPPQNQIVLPAQATNVYSLNAVGYINGSQFPGSNIISAPLITASPATPTLSPKAGIAGEEAAREKSELSQVEEQQTIGVGGVPTTHNLLRAPEMAGVERGRQSAEARGSFSIEKSTDGSSHPIKLELDRMENLGSAVASPHAGSVVLPTPAAEALPSSPPSLIGMLRYPGKPLANRYTGVANSVPPPATPPPVSSEEIAGEAPVRGPNVQFSGVGGITTAPLSEQGEPRTRLRSLQEQENKPVPQEAKNKWDAQVHSAGSLAGAADKGLPEGSDQQIRVDALRWNLQKKPAGAGNLSLGDTPAFGGRFGRPAGAVGGSGRGGGGGFGGGGGGEANRITNSGNITTSPIVLPGNGQVGAANFYADKDTGQVVSNLTPPSGGTVAGDGIEINKKAAAMSGKMKLADNTRAKLSLPMAPATTAPTSGTAESAKPVEPQVINMKFASASDIASALNALGASGGTGVAGSGTYHLFSQDKIIADERSNSLRVVANDVDMKMIQDIVKKLDVAPPQATLPALVPQPEIQTRSNVFSTFSLNVSDAAYKLAEASLQNGAMPEAGGIRSEEFINAFDYRDPEPARGAPIGFAWDRAGYPFAHNRDLLRFSVKTAAQGRQAGRPLNLVLLLDKSGSMERADRVEIIHQALRVLASQLQAQDKLSVVVFARAARLWVDGVPGSQAGGVADGLNSLTPEGGTNLEEAMKLAYATALRHYLAGGENRVVLLTDGAANLGNVDPETLKQKAEANHRQGIALDCFGVGWDGYNDNLMETLSRAGNGRYGFINTPEEAATEFAGKLAGALRVAASDVKVQVEFNPNRVTAWRQIGYAKHQLTKEQFRDNTVAAAQIGAAESGTALYTVEVNPAGDGPLGTVRVRFRRPGTTDYQEHAWDVPYTGAAATLNKAGPAMRLAATAAAFSEWLASSPYAGEVTPDRLLAYLRGVPEVYGADGRPKNLEWMIRQAKSITGK